MREGKKLLCGFFSVTVVKNHTDLQLRGKQIRYEDFILPMLKLNFGDYSIICTDLVSSVHN